MSKLTLQNLTNLQNETTAVSAINNNNDSIETALENTLSRDGTSPNVMNSSLDMNSNRILNLPDAVSDNEPVTLAQLSATNAGFAAGIFFTPSGAVSAINVQDAIEELDTEKANVSNLSAVAFSGAATDISFTGVTNLTGGQIKFPIIQSPSTDLNTLDDYEEGTFTPVFTATTTPPTGVTYTTQTGYYTKIGNRVFCDIRINLTSKGTGGVGTVNITGLPFTSANFTAPFSSGVSISNVSFPAGATQVVSCVNANSTSLFFNCCGSGIATAISQWSDWTNTGGLRLSFVYFV